MLHTGQRPLSRPVCHRPLLRTWALWNVRQAGERRDKGLRREQERGSAVRESSPHVLGTILGTDKKRRLWEVNRSHEVMCRSQAQTRSGAKLPQCSAAFAM